jgi:hypothetical protein
MSSEFMLPQGIHCPVLVISVTTAKYRELKHKQRDTYRAKWRRSKDPALQYILKKYLRTIDLKLYFSHDVQWVNVNMGHTFFFLWRYSPNSGLGLPPWNFPYHYGLLDLRQSVKLLGRMISSSQGLYLYTNTEKTHTHTQTPNIHALSGIWTHYSGFRASEDSACFRPLGYHDRGGATLVKVKKVNLSL